MANIFSTYYDHCFGAGERNSNDVFACILQAVIARELQGNNNALLEAIDVIDDKVSFINVNFEKAIADTLDIIADQTNASIEDLLSSAQNNIDENIFLANQFAGALYDQFLSDSDATIEQVLNVVNTTNASILAQTGASIQQTEGLINEITDRINSSFDLTDESVRDVIELINDDISKIIDSGVSGVEEITLDVLTRFDDVQRDISDKIQNDIDSHTDSLISELENRSNQTDEIINSFGDFALTAEERQSDLLKELAEGPFDSLGKVASFITDVIGFETPEQLTASVKENTDIWSSISIALSTSVNSPEDLAQVIADHKDKLGIFGEMLLSFMYVMTNVNLMTNLIGTVNLARIEKVRQNVLSEDPVNIFSLAEVGSLMAKNIIDEDWAENDSSKNGYKPEYLEAAKRANQTQLDINLLNEAYFRGKISDNDYIKTLERLGYNEKTIDTIISIRPIRPGIQDLITMSVREVFDPDMVRLFELDSDLPEQFIEEAKKNGLSEKWATRYWASHWKLPSAQQGFEMFHRNVIDNDTLKLLLRALDVSPFWRDKLEAIAYQPITRVDIRRLHALGLIDDNETNFRYQALGYSPNDANLMLEFTTALSVDSEDEGDIDVRQITNTQIKKLYLLGTIDKNAAVDSLNNNGYQIDTSRLLVDSWDMEIDIKSREDIINRMVKRAIRENLSADEVSSMFSAIDLTGAEREHLQTVIDLEQREYDSIPSKSELNKMHKELIINFDQWQDFYRKHGYSWEIISMYAKLNGFKNG
ncbi:MAG: hypothetical protein H8D23_25315 [Candidatus Brocadiales bacterium]|nr:hypothetical protein [Candidatus Brocadiales bacterium]